MNRVAYVAVVMAAATAAGCASSGEEVMSVTEAAQAECARRVPAPTNMQDCVEAEEDTIREARELARMRPPPPPPPRPPR